MRYRDFIIFLAVLTLTALISVSILPEQAIASGAWEEQLPAPGDDAFREALEGLDAAFLGDPTQKRVYLTFDAVSESGGTGKILELLRAHQAPAAFFITGAFLEQNPELVRRMVRQGCTVGNLTLHHQDMRKLSEFDAFSRELTGLSSKFQEITGQEPDKFYRPPQGLYTRENLEMARDLGYRTLFWSLSDRDPELLAHMHSGAVLRLGTDARQLEALLSDLEDSGYSFGEISEILRD